MNASSKSRLSVKGKKKKGKKKGSRAGSRASSRSSADSGDDRNVSRPDFEAELIPSKRSRILEVTNK